MLLSKLSVNHDENRMKHFHVLSREQQQQAIARLALSGMSDAGISRATGLSREMICRILSEASA